MGVCFLVNNVTLLSDPTRQSFVSEYFVDSRLKYASLETLIKFIAFLVKKLCQKYSKYVRNVPGDKRGFP